MQSRGGRSRPSVAHRTHRPDSDLDVALVIEPDSSGNFDDEFKAVAGLWKNELRQMIPKGIIIDVCPLHPTDPTKFPDNEKYVKECSICVFDDRNP